MAGDTVAVIGAGKKQQQSSVTSTLLIVRRPIWTVDAEGPAR